MDLFALLGGSGTGEFIGILTRSDLVPTESEMRRSRAFLGPGLFFGRDDFELLTAAWRFQREIVLVIAKVGQLSQHFRVAVSNQPDISSLEHVAQWRQQSLRCCDMLKQAWSTRMEPMLPSHLRDQRLSAECRSMLDFLSTRSIRK